MATRYKRFDDNGCVLVMGDTSCCTYALLYNFLYRRISDRPLAFHQQKQILSTLEIIAACLPIIVLMTTRNILPAVVIIGISILTRFAVKRVAYNRELREMTAFQQRENKMSKEEALDVARTLLDISIEHGERQ